MREMMTAVRVHAAGDLRLDRIPVPEPGLGEVLVKVWRSGICGTDLHIAKGNFPAPNLPLTLGHEFSGVIAATGEDTDPLAQGDNVVVDINIACGRCYFCRRGQKLFCPHVAQLGTPGSGHIPWDDYFSALADIDYSGQIVVESFLPTVEEIARAVSLWRPVAPSMQALAEDSLRFLQQELAQYTEQGR